MAMILSSRNKKALAAGWVTRANVYGSIKGQKLQTGKSSTVQISVAPLGETKTWPAH
jgi:hypothetical protein